MRTALTILLLSFGFCLRSQVLIDSIPLPDYGSNANFYGLDGANGMLYLGSDFDGQIISIDTEGNETGSFSSPYDFCHGLAKTNNGFYIVEDYNSSGARMYEIDEAGSELAVFDLPEGILGPASGVGGLDKVGDAVWFTVYYQDSDVYPFAYAYLWNPLTSTYLDTVPMSGGQPQGIEQIGNLLVYVIDDNDDDLEQLYGYDLLSEEEVFAIDLPDTQNDNDQSPRGLYFDGSYLWLMADRSGPGAFSFNTLYKYDMSGVISGVEDVNQVLFSLYPNPAHDVLYVNTDLFQEDIESMRIYDIRGKEVLRPAWSTTIAIDQLNQGVYYLALTTKLGTSRQPFIVNR